MRTASHTILTGAYLALGAFFCFSLQDASVKWLVAGIAVVQVLFVRSAVSQGEVVEIAGPWRTTGQWWSETGHFAVDHYDVQMSDGNVLRLCFDWKQNQWQVDGLYD